jgi:hypothetical protein
MHQSAHAPDSGLDAFAQEDSVNESAQSFANDQAQTGECRCGGWRSDRKEGRDSHWKCSKISERTEKEEGTQGREERKTKSKRSTVARCDLKLIGTMRNRHLHV